MREIQKFKTSDDKKFALRVEENGKNAHLLGFDENRMQWNRLDSWNSRVKVQTDTGDVLSGRQKHDDDLVNEATERIQFYTEGNFVDPRA